MDDHAKTINETGRRRIRFSEEPISRRAFLARSGLLGAAGLAAPLLPRAWPPHRRSRIASPGSLPIRHVIIDCQENRSFDHYFGFAPFFGSHGVPAGYSQPEGLGGSVTPYEFMSLSTAVIGHSWTAVQG